MAVKYPRQRRAQLKHVPAVPESRVWRILLIGTLGFGDLGGCYNQTMTPFFNQP